MKSSSPVRASDSANLESTTPVTQVTAADVVTQGVTRIEDLVNQLPQAFAAQNVTVVERRDRHGDAEPSRSRLAPHAGADRRPPHALWRRDLGLGGAGHQPDPDVDDRAGRHPHRRRLGGVRLGCRRRRRQLHHEEGLRGRAGHQPVQLLLARERLQRPGRGQAARHRSRGRADDQPGGVRAAGRLRDRRRGQGALADGRRQQRRRPRQHHGLRHGVRQRRDAAGGPRLFRLLAEPEPGRLLHLRRLVDERRRPLHGLLDLRLHDRHRDTAFRDYQRRDATCTTSAR